MRIRSYLYAPGNRADLIAKVATQGADAVILDLEDAVPPAEKARACDMASDFLSAGPAVPAFVRLNGGAAALQDIARLQVAGLFGVLVAKAETAEQIRAIDQALSEREREAGRVPGSVIIQPLIESVAGLYGLDAIAGASLRIRRVGFGAGDFVRDLRAQQTAARTETLYARMRLVAHSRLLQLDAPVAHVYSRIRDLEGLHRACAEDRALGFGGRSCIHPTQVATVNTAFSPTAEEITQARKVLSAYAEAIRAGRGSLLLDDGTFIDEAIALRAKDVLVQAS